MLTRSRSARLLRLSSYCALGRARRPFLLLDDMPEVVQFCGWDGVAGLDDLSVGAPEPNHATIGRVRRERVESGGAYMPPDRLQILARGTTCAQAKVEDELIDVREHATARGTSRTDGLVARQH